MKIHCCLLDRECRRYGGPARIHIDTKKYHIVIALTSDAQVQSSKDPKRWVWFDIDNKEKE